MFFYNQNNYANVPYNKPNGTKATVKSGGCGVCSALMVLNNLYGKEVMTVPQMAKFSIANGARSNDGTDMFALLNALCKKYKLSYKTTSSNAELWNHLKKGGMAILNQGNAYNVFSTAGHFVVGYKPTGSDTVICLDPSLYAGKYDSSPRNTRIVKQVGNEVYVKLSQIGKATVDRNPSYYLVTYTGTHAPTIKAGQTVKLKKKAKLYNDNSSKSGVRKICNFSKFDSTAEAQFKVGASIKCDKVVTKANKNIWVYIEQYNGWVCVYDYKNDISKV